MIKIPFRLVNGIMLIPAAANEKEGFFAFDTGAMQTAVNKAYCFRDDPQLIPVSQTPNIVTIPAVYVGENEYRSVAAVISDISAIQKKVPVEGVIGYQVLSPQRSILDFGNNQLIMEKTRDNG